VGPGSSWNPGSGAGVATLTNLQAPLSVRWDPGHLGENEGIESALRRFKRQVSKGGIFASRQGLCGAITRPPLRSTAQVPAAPSSSRAFAGWLGGTESRKTDFKVQTSALSPQTFYRRLGETS